MSEITEKSGNKGLVITLVILCLMIVGLGVGIGMTTNSGNDGLIRLDDNETSSVAASEVFDELESRYINNMDITAEEVVLEFQRVIESTNDVNYKVMVAIWCAKFISEYGDGLEAAVNYLDNNWDASRLDDFTREYYYNNLAYYYNMLGDTDKAAFYIGKINNISLNYNGGIE